MLTMRGRGCFYVAVCCRALQCVAVYFIELQCVGGAWERVFLCCSVLQCVAICSLLCYVAVCWQCVEEDILACVYIYIYIHIYKYIIYIDS